MECTFVKLKSQACVSDKQKLDFKNDDRWPKI